jgi:arabinofuranan 3-O-arabinosyltransferase
VTWQRQNPANFSMSVASGGPTVVALAENFAPGWRLDGGAGAEHVTLQGWMNGWRLPAGATATATYGPAKVSRYALYLLPVAVAAALGWMWFWRRRRLRRPVRDGVAT